MYVNGGSPTKVVDQGVATLSWSGGQADIMLSASVDTSLHMAEILNVGDDLGGAGQSFRYTLMSDRIRLYTTTATAGNNKACSWQVRKVPSGAVQRGIASVSAGATGGAGTTNDISLSSPRTSASLLHACQVGRFCSYVATDNFATGYLKPHASNSSKIQAVLTSIGAGGTGHSFSWEVWVQ
jgi:hypothetical protein